jgi:hypothetical protein
MSAFARRLIAPAIIVIALAIGASAAYGDSTRAEYVAAAEPICKAAQKPTFKAYASFFKGLKRAGLVGDNPDISKRTARISAHLLGAFYLRVSSIFSGTTSQIATISAAPGDEAAVATWLMGRDRAAQLGAQAGRVAKHQKIRRAVHLSDQAGTASEEAAKSVVGYGFTFCALPWGEADSG